MTVLNDIGIPTVSVVVLTYNHEAYIEKAINSILEQKTNFAFEVLIGEDRSTDNTRIILKDMQKALPSNFQIFYREKNLGVIENEKDLFERARGKYLIELESDDYWNYEYKLQKQVDFLESNSDYIAVAHNTRVVDKNDKVIVGYEYPECKDKEFTYKNIKRNQLPGQTASILRINPRYVQGYEEPTLPFFYPGDRLTSFCLLRYGRVACIQEKWSTYRRVVDSGDSFSANIKKFVVPYVSTLKFYEELYNYTLRKGDNMMATEAAESLYYYQFLYVAIKKLSREYTMSDWIAQIPYVKFKYKVYSYIVFRLIKGIVKNVESKIKRKSR